MSWTLQGLVAQMLLGLINGAFYATLSLGLSVVFGLLGLVNFMHGVTYMAGAFGAWALMDAAGLPFAWALVLVPAAMLLVGVAIERSLLQRLYSKDHLVGLLVTLGLAMVIEASFRNAFGAVGHPYPNPLPGAVDVGFAVLPLYRLWVLVAAVLICGGTWAFFERTRFGAQLRAAIERPDIVQALGIDVPRLRYLTFGAGTALAGLAGVLAAPIYQVNPSMGNSLLVIVFAVVVIGGMGSVMGSVAVGFMVGLAEAVVKVLYPPAAPLTVFVVMIAVLLLCPRGLFSR